MYLAGARQKSEIWPPICPTLAGSSIHAASMCNSAVWRWGEAWHTDLWILTELITFTGLDFSNRGREFVDFRHFYPFRVLQLSHRTVHLLWNLCAGEVGGGGSVLLENVRGMPTGQAWSWHLCLSGYKLEPAKHSQRSTEMAARERWRERKEEREGEPQIQKERKSKRRRNSGSEARKEGVGGSYL